MCKTTDGVKITTVSVTGEKITLKIPEIRIPTNTPKLIMEMKELPKTKQHDDAFFNYLSILPQTKTKQTKGENI